VYLKSIYLKNFRIYKEKLIEFSPQINVIWGANAIGKTTILEAIYYLISGKSFRTDKPQDLISSGQSYFYIEAQFVKHGILQTLKVSYDGKDRKIFYNSTKLALATHLLGIMQGVLMTPGDADLVKGSPQVRRHFFDLQIAQADPLYVHYITRYLKAMQQRNCLLKRKSHIAIDSFEHEMAVAAAYISTERQQLVKDLEVLSGTIHKKLAGDDERLNVQYKTPSATVIERDKLKTYYLELFKKNRMREMELGCTLSGPHKDDLLIFVNEKEARQFASEGQQRCAVTSLRLSEWDRLKNASLSCPLMLIDDLGISLDKNRKAAILTHLQSLSQVFITLTEAASLPNVYQRLIEVTS
jgi:DNA replication and repair protein RecF